MADTKADRPGAAATKRTERRFLPRSNARAHAVSAAVALGGLSLGAGVYGQLVRAEPHPWGVWLLAGGAALVSLGLMAAEPGRVPVRVGDAGVAVERGGSDLLRVAWCDVERVALEGGNLVVESKRGRIAVSVSAHREAAAWIVREAHDRLPARVRLSEAERKAIGPADAGAGQSLPIEDVQLAGRRCKASGKLLTFEEDARACGRCGEVYHREHVPAECTTCEAKIDAGGRAA